MKKLLFIAMLFGSCMNNPSKVKSSKYDTVHGVYKTLPNATDIVSDSFYIVYDTLVGSSLSDSFITIDHMNGDTIKAGEVKNVYK
jgi:hypothetical protein